MLRRFAVPLLVAVALAGGVACGDSSRPTVSDEVVRRGSGTETLTLDSVPEGSSLIAAARGPSVAVYDAPDAPAPAQEIQPIFYPQCTEEGQKRCTPAGPVTVPLVFLVFDQQDGWLDVYLPVRPNGSRGWIRERDVTLSVNPYRIVVDITNHQITVFEDNQPFLEGPIGVGTQDTPTPGGIYFIRELLQPPDPTTVYGPYAYGLSGFSDALDSFEGGEPIIGIHGNNDESALGQDVSAGCIRMDNDQITELVEKPLPLGTPVEIIA